MAATGSEFALGAHDTIPKGLPVCIAILDGYGENEFQDEYNAVHSANTPVFDKLRAASSRFRTVAAHGPAVGLPSSDDMGNSEVGHNAVPCSDRTVLVAVSPPAACISHIFSLMVFASDSAARCG